jgi:hypothetical protein
LVVRTIRSGGSDERASHPHRLLRDPERICHLAIIAALLAWQQRYAEAHGFGGLTTGLVGVIGTFRPKAPTAHVEKAETINQIGTHHRDPRDPATVGLGKAPPRKDAGKGRRRGSRAQRREHVISNGKITLAAVSTYADRTAALQPIVARSTDTVPDMPKHLLDVLPLLLLTACLGSTRSTVSSSLPQPKPPAAALLSCLPTPARRQPDGSTNRADTEGTARYGRLDPRACDDKRQLLLDAWPK